MLDGDPFLPETAMDALIPVLIAMNIMLGIALFIGKLAQLDRRHVRARIDEEERDSRPYRRNGRD